MDSLRRAAALYKSVNQPAPDTSDTSVISIHSNRRESSNSAAGAAANSPGCAGQRPKNRVSYLHILIVRLLLSRTVSPIAFEECYSQMRKDLGETTTLSSAVAVAQAASAPTVAASSSSVFSSTMILNLNNLSPVSSDFPITLPALFAACAADRTDVDALSQGEHVPGKLRAVLSNPAMKQYFLEAPATDAERFAHLWAPESFYNPRMKKFATRIDLIVHAAHHYGGKGNSNSSTPKGNNTNSVVVENALHWYRAIWQPWLVTLSQEAAQIAASQQHQQQIYSDDGSAVSSAEDAVDPELNEIAQRLVFHLNEMKKIVQRAEAQSGDATSSGGPHDATTTVQSLDEQFKEAEQQFGKIAGQQPVSVKLAMYSLYKQATVGDVTGSRPWAMDVAGRAKYDAWAGRKGIGSEQAKKAYVENFALLLAGQLR